MRRFNRILLVNPPGTDQGGYTPSPLGLLYLAAYLREHDKKIKLKVEDSAVRGDSRLREVVKEYKPDLVGISILTTGRHAGLKVARMVKEMDEDTKTVFGGIHPSLMWKQMMENYPEVDFIVRGEGEISLYELVSGVAFSKIAGLVWRRKGGSIINNENRSFIAEIDKLPFPAWDLVDDIRYPPRGEGVVNGIDLEKETRFSMIFTRGCMAACNFCSSWIVWRGYRSRSGKNVADEVEMLVDKYGAKHVCFYDDTLTGNREEIMNFCKEILQRKIQVAFLGNTRVDKVDGELLRLMKKAGFYEIEYGVESGSPAMLLKINKRIDLENIKKAVNMTKKVGIRAVALMMYGLPGETADDRLMTEELLDKINPDDVGTLGEVWIFPGTALYEQAKHAKIIDDSYWLGKRPNYVYRGGIKGDPIDWKMRVQDTLKFYFEKSWLNKLRISLGLTYTNLNLVYRGSILKGIGS